MTDLPLDPNDMDSDYDSEFSYGLGLFPPGIAGNEGQTRHQDDFGDNMIPRTNGSVGDFDDNYARMVADRRTDTTDPDSNRDFESLGNPDRFGAQPPLIRSDPQPNQRTMYPPEKRTGVERKW